MEKPRFYYPGEKPYRMISVREHCGNLQPQL